MTLAQTANAAGVAGVLLILIAYGGAQFDRLPPREAPALLLNLIGASLILWSLGYRFNLAAFLMEGAWAFLAFYGLARLAFSARSRGRTAGRPRPPSRRSRA